jgi:hypothetical protein
MSAQPLEGTMKSLHWNSELHRATPRSEPATPERPVTHAPVPSAINTILAVREHAPAEIAELEMEIQNLHRRLGVAYARKRLLEQLLAVIRRSEADSASMPDGMSVMR